MDNENSTKLIYVRNRSISNGPKLTNQRSDHGIDILKVDGKEYVCVFGRCQRHEDPDKTDTFPLLDSIEVYYP